MTFYSLFSVVAILVAIVGCVVIWGYDARRADRSEVDVREATRSGGSSAARQRIAARRTD